jgi:hypothetical protein
VHKDKTSHIRNILFINFIEEAFSETTDVTMCPGVDSASKNEYQDIPWGKEGRCVRVTTLPPS